jgi:peroxiredoxin (alkyl hydroperoxide reductase subunit C)
MIPYSYIDSNVKSNQLSNPGIVNSENIIPARKECVTLGRLAPDFMALSTHGYIRLSDYRGKWLVLTSHPMSFTPVSTTEIIQASRNYAEYIKRNTNYLTLTTDNNFANLAWIYDIYKTTGVIVPFPIITDSDKEISQLYGMMNMDRRYEESVRDGFIINPEGKIRAILSLPTTTGRGGYEILRVLDSLQLEEKYHYYTPADWNPGDPVIVPAPNTSEELFKRINTMDSSGYQCPSWYLCFTNMENEIKNSAPAANNPTTNTNPK